MEDSVVSVLQMETAYLPWRSALKILTFTLVWTTSIISGKMDEKTEKEIFFQSKVVLVKFFFQIIISLVMLDWSSHRGTTDDSDNHSSSILDMVVIIIMWCGAHLSASLITVKVLLLGRSPWLWTCGHCSSSRNPSAQVAAYIKKLSCLAV